jgi:heme exporter protein A
MTLTANALACERNGRVVFSGMSFTVRPGELMVLRGPNGAGKSSLLRMVAGLVPKLFGSLSLTHLPPEQALASQCHYIGHQDGLKNTLSLRENLSFWAAMLGGTWDDKHFAPFALQQLADDPVQLLSAGQRRRATLTRLVAVTRPVWLLDEPMTALDQTSQATLSRLMADHMAQGGMVLAATHDDMPLTPHHVVELGAAP